MAFRIAFLTTVLILILERRRRIHRRAAGMARSTTSPRSPCSPATWRSRSSSGSSGSTTATTSSTCSTILAFTTVPPLPRPDQRHPRVRRVAVDRLLRGGDVHPARDHLLLPEIDQAKRSGSDSTCEE
ncbi:MAG: hypothetical protein M0C28_18715 [Candidatus Moduliflexus flocculans]|nr:hypothetical protein [Candidatus Moduliflexus flocculans]